jgi:phytoene dehydrogenase-like protein
VAERDGGTPDAVVIGAGPNGLVAANILAHGGWRVVCEEQAEPGGEGEYAHLQVGDVLGQ